MNHYSRYLLAVVLACSAACGGDGSVEPPKPTAAAGKKVDAATAGSIAMVKFEGTVPANLPIKLSKDCAPAPGDAPLNEAVLVGKDGALRNAFIYVKAGLDTAYTFDAPTAPVELKFQKGCIYSPRVMGVRVGQPIDVVNTDATMHNVHALPMVNQEFNKSQPVQNSHMTQVFTAPEVMVRFMCNVHSWMSSYIGVMEHPYFAVSDEAGHFEIKNLPPGTYTIEAWHEKFGRRTAEVTVGDKQAQTAAFTFTADSKSESK